MVGRGRKKSDSTKRARPESAQVSYSSTASPGITFSVAASSIPNSRESTAPVIYTCGCRQAEAAPHTPYGRIKSLLYFMTVVVYTLMVYTIGAQGF